MNEYVSCSLTHHEEHRDLSMSGLIPLNITISISVCSCRKLYK